ncbi:hypothetical protein GCM10010275_03230 [Streptomyces litmocidini]|nr:hypothetical protein GCM10010275_03230 [Streptomyces litmocidini]
MRYGRGVRFELHGGLSSSGRSGLLAGVSAGTGRCLSRGPFTLSSPFEDKQKGRGSRMGFRGPEGAGLIMDQTGSLQGSSPRKAHIMWCCVVVCCWVPAPVAAKP